MRVPRPTADALHTLFGICLVAGIIASQLARPPRVGDPCGWTGEGRLALWEVVAFWLCLLSVLCHSGMRLLSDVFDGHALLLGKPVTKTLVLQSAKQESIARLHLGAREGLYVQTRSRSGTAEPVFLQFTLATIGRFSDLHPSTSVQQTVVVREPKNRLPAFVLIPSDRPGDYALAIRVLGCCQCPVVATVSWAPSLVLRDKHETGTTFWTRVLPHARMANAMRWIVAVVGGLLVFAVVFIVTGLVLASAWPQGLRFSVGVGWLSTNNPIGFVLAALAATHSFRASLRRRAKKGSQDVGATGTKSGKGGSPL
jgi:hypothetical protein